MSTSPARIAGSAWGRWPRYRHQIERVHARTADPALTAASTWLPWGNGRSYGDSCQNDGGGLLDTRGLDHFIRFDDQTGVLECEPGVTLADIITLCLPRGWFLPVTPGTSFVTVGGAIANDVHGKNHHRAGSFNDHVDGFELWRSDGSRRWCSPQENSDWFAATAGGLGLTGLITRARLRLRRVPGPALAGQSRRFGDLAEFFALSATGDRAYEYTVAWLDCVGRRRGRGIYMAANHAQADCAAPSGRPLSMPITPPVSLVNPLSLAAFNRLYYHRPSAEQRDALWHYQPFFYPLDSIHNWNRMYGPRGFFQYQCVVPMDQAGDALDALLARISRARGGSFLAVLKVFGDRPAPGLLSFPRPGATLALDFPNTGAAVLALLDALDDIVREAGGAVYPAKDARMPGAAFRQYFPAWQAFSDYIDPRFSSSFWRRVMDTET